MIVTLGTQCILVRGFVVQGIPFLKYLSQDDVTLLAEPQTNRVRLRSFCTLCTHPEKDHTEGNS